MKNKQAPNLWNLGPSHQDGTLLADVFKNSVEIDGTWYPARPLGLDTLSNRIRLAWLVFTGKCDAIKWPGDQ